MPLVRDETGVYRFNQIFNQRVDLVHGFSGRSFGDVKTYQNQGGPAQNLNRFLTCLGTTIDSLVRAKQEHGSEIREVGWPDRGAVVGPADGLISRKADLFLAVFVADCLPLLFFDPIKRVIGLAHAGWRGTAKGIGRKMIEHFCHLGSDPRQILVGLGPSICVNHYQVGDQGIVQETFAKEDNRAGVFVGDRLDLEKTNIRQLIESEIQPQNIEVSGVCTFEDQNFYSFRKEGNQLSGETVAVIGISDSR